MIYLYFDSNNVLRETIQTKSFIQGSTNVDGIAVYSELFEDDGFTLDDIWYTQQLPDDTKTNEVSFIDNLQEGVIPYNAKADYKYFKDYTTYKFYVFEFTTEYLSQQGLNIGTIRLSYDNSIVALGEITFNVGTGVVKDDNYITQSQYDYLLLAYASRTLNATAGADLETLLDDKVEAKVGTQVEEVFEPFKESVEEDIADFKEEVDDRLDEQDDRITTEMASITQPKYYDISSLPTTNVGLIVGSDGYIYSWNGTQYVTTNIVYQASQIADGSVTYTKLGNDVLDIFDNYVNDNPIVSSSGNINGYYAISNNTITFTSTNNFTCSHFTKVYGIFKISLTLLTNASNTVILKHNDNTYSTYAVISGSYEIDIPDDATDIYVNYWNNTYLNSISYYTKKLVNGNLTYLSANIYNMNTRINNKIMNYSNGNIENSVGSAMSQYIKVTPNSTLWINQTYHHICFLTLNRQFISGVLHTTTNPFSITIPNNAHYVVISGDASAMGEYLMVNIGDNALPLEPNGIYLRDGYLIKEVVEARDGYDTLKEKINSIINYKSYQSGWINFQVSVNQYIVNNSNTSNTLIDDETNKINVDCVLKLPNTYSKYGKPSKLLMVCHGAGRGVYGSNFTPWIDMVGYNNMLSNFVNRGYVVFDCNGYKNDIVGVDFWGCPRGVEAWRKAYDHIVQNYNVEREFSIYGFSMGGLTALNLAFSNFPNIKCIALGSPVVALDDDVYERAGGEILLAYGINSWDVSNPSLIGSNPIKNLININNTDYCFKNLPPIKIWYGSTEIFPSPSLALQLVNSIKNAGGQADYRLVNGAGHEICYGENANINAEYLYFIDRYNN